MSGLYMNVTDDVIAIDSSIVLPSYFNNATTSEQACFILSYLTSPVTEIG